jgi:hypothetical protein
MDGLPCVSSASFIFHCLISESPLLLCTKTWFVIMKLCELFFNVELVLWSRLCVGFAHISDSVVSDSPGMTRQRRQNTSLLLVNDHVDRLRR